MNTSSLEITDQEYLIKLSKTDFDLSFINQLLKRIQAEQNFFIWKNNDTACEDIKSRTEHRDGYHPFDNLNDK